MAKKITNTQVENPELPDTAVPADTETPIAKEKMPAKEKKTEVALTEISPHVEAVLKMNKGYEFLYIDAQGGTYTEDTPKYIRKSSTLYKNPFYNSKNN